MLSSSILSGLQRIVIIHVLATVFATAVLVAATVACTVFIRIAEGRSCCRAVSACMQSPFMQCSGTVGTTGLPGSLNASWLVSATPGGFSGHGGNAIQPTWYMALAIGMQ